MPKRWDNQEAFTRYLRDRRLELNLTQGEVSTDLGKSHSFIYHVEKGWIPGIDALIQLAKRYGDNPHDYIAARYQFKGKDQAYEAWRQMVTDASGAVNEHAPPYAGSLDGSRPVPVINLAKCGQWLDFGDKDYPVGIADDYAMAMTNDDNAFFVRAEGDSMRPNIQDGDLVLIQPNLEVQSGNVVFVRTDEGVALKRIHISDKGQITLSSDNASYPPIIITKKRGFKCFRATDTISKL